MSYRLDLNQNPELAESLQKCSNAFQFNLVMLPIFVSHEVDGPCAYVTPSGIWVHERVVQNDPGNFHVYLGHEVFHWVVNNYSILSKFNPIMVNYITDFKINELLYTLFSWSVRKVKYKGLLNKKWFGKSLHEIGLAIIREDWIEEKTCSAEGIPHPLIGECASRLRRRFKDHLEATQEVFHLTVDEERIFSDALRVIDRTKIHFKTSNVDKYVMLKAVWYCFWHKQPFAMRPEGVLPPEHQFVFSTRWPQGMVTVGNAVDSMWAAVRLIKAMDSDEYFIYTHVANARERVVSTMAKLNEARGKKTRRKLKLRLKRHEASLKKWESAKPLSVLLKEDTIRLKQGMEMRTRPRTMFSSMTETTDVLLPQVRVNESVKRIRLLTRKPMRLILETVDSMDLIQEAMGNAFTNNQEGEDELLGDALEAAAERENVEKAKQETDKEKATKNDEDGAVAQTETEEEAEAREKVKDALEEDGAEEGDSDSEDSEEASDAKRKVKSKKDAAVNSGKSEGKIAQSESEIDSSMGLSDGAGKRDNAFAKQRMEVMDTLTLKQNQIARILSFMAEAETLIKQLQKQKTRIGEEGPDATYEYGNNLANMAPEEVAFLTAKSTKLAFLVKYSTHQLLQRAPLESRKQPTILMLDQSGSMFSGSMYEMAAGFCLAVLKYMMKEKRGVSFTVFDSQNGREVHADIGDKVDIVAVLKIITTPSRGGTNFQSAFERSLQIRDHFMWKSFTGLCVTDGKDNFNHPEAIRDHMKPKDKFIGVVVGRNDGDSLAPVCDEIRYVKDRSLIELVNASKSIF